MLKKFNSTPLQSQKSLSDALKSEFKKGVKCVMTCPPDDTGIPPPQICSFQNSFSMYSAKLCELRVMEYLYGNSGISNLKEN